MAWVVSRSVLTPALIEQIGQDLWLKAKESYGGVPPVPFPAFIAGRDTVALPFFYGRKLLPNYRLPRPRGRYRSWTFAKHQKLSADQEVIVSEVLTQIYTEGSSNVNSACASGKTVMGCFCAVWVSQWLAQIGLSGPVIIVYSLKALQSQWVSTITNFSNARVAVVDSGEAARGVGEADVYLCMVESLDQLPPEVLGACSLLMIDEAHLFCTKHRLDKLLAVNPVTVLMLTATPARANGLNTILDVVAGAHAVKRISMKPFAIWRHDTGLKPPIVLNKQGKPDWNEIVKWLVENQKRNEMIVDWVVKNPTRKIAILTTRTSHVDVLYQMLLERGESVGVLYKNITKYSHCRVLVGTESKMGTGFDEKANCDDFDGHRIDMLLLTVSGKQCEQKAGRSFRADRPHIIHLVDEGGIFEKHWKICYNWYVQPERENLVKVYITDKTAVLPEMLEDLPVPTEDPPVPTEDPVGGPTDKVV